MKEEIIKSVGFRNLMLKNFCFGMMLILMFFFAIVFARSAHANIPSTNVCQVPASIFQATSGPWSYGILSIDAMQSWDFIMHVNDEKGIPIYSRTGASLTVLKNGRFEWYFGAVASSGGAFALIGGPALEMNDIMSASLIAMLKALPIAFPDEVFTTIQKSARLKAHGGYDFRYEGKIAGIGAGWAF